MKHLFLIILALFFVVGCADDDNPSGPTESSIIGMWELEEYYVDGEPDEVDNLTLTFSDDGMVAANNAGFSYELSWTLNGNTLSLLLPEVEIPFQMNADISSSRLELSYDEEDDDGEMQAIREVYKRV